MWPPWGSWVSAEPPLLHIGNGDYQIVHQRLARWGFSHWLLLQRQFYDFGATSLRTGSRAPGRTRTPTLPAATCYYAAQLSWSPRWSWWTNLHLDNESRSSTLFCRSYEAIGYAPTAPDPWSHRVASSTQFSASRTLGLLAPSRWPIRLPRSSFLWYRQDVVTLRRFLGTGDGSTPVKLEGCLGTSVEWVTVPAQPSLFFRQVFRNRGRFWLEFHNSFFLKLCRWLNGGGNLHVWTFDWWLLVKIFSIPKIVVFDLHHFSLSFHIVYRQIFNYLKLDLLVMVFWLFHDRFLLHGFCSSSRFNMSFS